MSCVVTVRRQQANGMNRTFCADLKDMSVMVLRTRGPAKLPQGYKLAMHISQGDAESIRVFRPRSAEVLNKTRAYASNENAFLMCRIFQSSTFLNVVCVLSSAVTLLFNYFVKDYPLVLSSDVLTQEVPYLGGISEMNFYVEGLRFLDKDFDGLISVNLSVLEPITAVRPASRLRPCVHYVVGSCQHNLVLYDEIVVQNSHLSPTKENQG